MNIHRFSQYDHDDLKLGLSQKSKEATEQRIKTSRAPNYFITRHANNIYEKLGVHSRTEAAAKARILNILD
jgi:hypothetical protein